MTVLIRYYDHLNPILDADERKKLIDDYNAWIPSQPSIIDGDWCVSMPHHVRTCNNAGTGMKPHDLWQIPITYDQHDRVHHYDEKLNEIIFEKLPELHDQFIEDTNQFKVKTFRSIEKFGLKNRNAR